MYEKDGRSKVPRSVVATHLGHDSLSGPALGKIGALRAYGLLEGGGDELRISDDALAALRAPEGSPERGTALVRLAFNPPLFQEIRKNHHDRPSKPTLAFWLQKRGFAENAATIAAQSYLATLDLVVSLSGSYDGSLGGDSAGDSPPMPVPTRQPKVSVMDGERIVFTEEGQPNQYLKLIASGPIDDGLLEALEDFVKRQRRRVNSALHRDRERWQADLAKFEEAGLGDSGAADTIRGWIREADQILDTP
ncbi:MAG: hypothetical protein ACRD2G_02230 [Terriglobia bacterium]